MSTIEDREARKFTPQKPAPPEGLPSRSDLRSSLRAIRGTWDVPQPERIEIRDGAQAVVDHPEANQSWKATAREVLAAIHAREWCGDATAK